MGDYDEIDRQVAGGSAARLGPPPKDAPPDRSFAFSIVFWVVLVTLVVAAIRYFSN